MNVSRYVDIYPADASVKEKSRNFENVIPKQPGVEGRGLRLRGRMAGGSAVFFHVVPF